MSLFRDSRRYGHAFRPLARKKGLVFQEFESELLVYDLDRDRAHSLNQEALAIWEICDGKHSVGSLAEGAARKLGRSIDEDFVLVALERLSEASLLESSTGLPNRRKAIGKMGAAALALPVVASITVPAAAQVSSCVGNGGMCGSDTECCSGVCEVGICATPELRELESIEIDVKKLQDE